MSSPSGGRSTVRGKKSLPGMFLLHNATRRPALAPKLARHGFLMSVVVAADMSEGPRQKRHHECLIYPKRITTLSTGTVYLGHACYTGSNTVDIVSASLW